MLLSSLIFLLVSELQRPPVSEAEIQAVDLAAGWVQVAVPTGETLSKDAELVVAAEVLPLGRFRLTEQDAERAIFARKQPLTNLASGRLRAWLVWPGLPGRLWDKWPAEADFGASIERVGPGARGVWINAGAASGIQLGMNWWARIDGQPIARFDVLSVERDACFCSVVRLAANAAIRRDDRVALWPSPGQRRSGAAVSAVSYVERSTDRTIVWVAAPRGAQTPAEPHLDFFHGGHCVAHAIVESMDDLFWYGRLIEPASTGGGDHSRQTAPPVAVGDLALIRTQADIKARSFVARVFEVSADGAIIDAGEADGITTGETASLYRGAVKLGDIRIGRIQSGYSSIEPIDERTEPPTMRPDGQQPASGEKLPWKPAGVPAVGDTVRFTNPPEPPISLAEIDGVVDGTLFSAFALARAEIPALAPLLVRTEEQGGGVALVLASDGERLCGLVLESSLRAPLRPGAILQQPSAATPAESLNPPMPGAGSAQNPI